MNERENLGNNRVSDPKVKRPRMSRRQFIKRSGAVLPPLFLAAYFFRFELRQLIKDFLKNYPDLYKLAAQLEEFGLQNLGMPVRVKNRYPYIENTSSTATMPPTNAIEGAHNAQDAVDLFQAFPRVPLNETAYHDISSDLDFQTFHLPETLARNEFITMVLGCGMTTPFGEQIPADAVAMRINVPKVCRAVIAPAVPVPQHNSPNTATLRYASGDYRLLNLPRYLYSQTVLSTGHLGQDLQVIPNAERMVIDGIDFQGAEFQKRNIEPGTVYLTTDGTNWELVEWPNEDLTKKDSSCARMIWNLNPFEPNVGRRVFRPYTEAYFGEQAAQQHGFINHMIVHAQYEQIGPTPIYRTDEKTHESDIIFIAPFLPLVAPDMLKDIVLKTPVGTKTSASQTDNLLVVMPDAKYSTAYGFQPAMLNQPNGVNFKMHDTKRKLELYLFERTSEFGQMNNSLAFYIGKDN